MNVEVGWHGIVATNGLASRVSQKRDSGHVIQWSIDFRENRGDRIRIEHGMDLGPMFHNFEEEFQGDGGYWGCSLWPILCSRD